MIAPRDWPAVLDAYADHLVDVRRALEAGMPDPLPAFPIPTGLPPLPPELADRAIGLLGMGERLADALADARNATGASLEHRPRPVPPPPRPSMLDVHA